MKSLIYFVAIIAQFVCMIVMAAKYGFEAGLLFVFGLICNAIQLALTDKE